MQSFVFTISACDNFTVHSMTCFSTYKTSNSRFQKKYDYSFNISSNEATKDPLNETIHPHDILLRGLRGNMQ